MAELKRIDNLYLFMKENGLIQKEQKVKPRKKNRDKWIPQAEKTHIPGTFWVGSDWYQIPKLIT